MRSKNIQLYNNICQIMICLDFWQKKLSQLNEKLCESLGVNVRSWKEEREGVK